VKRTIGIAAGLCVMALLCQGCVLAVAGIIADHEMTKSDYNSYVKETRQDNTEREEHGLKSHAILSYSDWKKGVGENADGSPIIVTNSPSKPLGVQK
jgi:hypothetical protein